MKITRGIALAILITSSACTTVNNQNEEGSQAEIEVNSQLDRIEQAFQSGRSKEACKMNLQLSKNLDINGGLSKRSLESIKEIQVKCKTKTLSIQFK